MSQLPGRVNYSWITGTLLVKRLYGLKKSSAQRERFYAHPIKVICTKHTFSFAFVLELSSQPFRSSFGN
jgi:hypothetical protein